MVRGAKWQDARGEYLVASCNMSGAGFRAFSETRDADKKERGVFVLAAHGEPNFVKRGAIRWMHRAQDGPWKSLHEEVLWRSEEHTSELQSRPHLVCRLLLEKKKK